MNKLKHRLTTIALVFAFPLFMAIAFTISNRSDVPVALILYIFAMSYGLESSILVLCWVCYLIWKGE